MATALVWLRPLAWEEVITIISYLATAAGGAQLIILLSLNYNYIHVACTYCWNLESHSRVSKLGGIGIGMEMQKNTQTQVLVKLLRLVWKLVP